MKILHFCWTTLGNKITYWKKWPSCLRVNHQKQISQAGISNCIPQNTVGCNYLSLPEIPASYDFTRSQWVNWPLAGPRWLFSKNMITTFPDYCPLIWSIITDGRHVTNNDKHFWHPLCQNLQYTTCCRHIIIATITMEVIHFLSARVCAMVFAMIPFTPDWANQQTMTTWLPGPEINK